jgi:hypothetical protein
MGWKRGLVTAATLFLVVALSASARAQNMFYREVAKDGRIFVFANGSRYATWEASGGVEMGASITRLGFGPNGETVVFDSEDAINLYLFKHDKPGEVFEKPKEAPRSPYPSWKISGLVFGDYYYFTDHHDPKFQDQNGFWLRRLLHLRYTFGEVHRACGWDEQRQPLPAATWSLSKDPPALAVPAGSRCYISPPPPSTGTRVLGPRHIEKTRPHRIDSSATRSPTPVATGATLRGQFKRVGNGSGADSSVVRGGARFEKSPASWRRRAHVRRAEQQPDLARILG